jgi:hypothetical protein
LQLLLSAVILNVINRLNAAGVNGVRNSHFAGKVHLKTGVPFDKSGFPK